MLWRTELKHGLEEPNAGYVGTVDPHPGPSVTHNEGEGGKRGSAGHTGTRGRHGKAVLFVLFWSVQCCSRVAQNNRSN